MFSEVFITCDKDITVTLRPEVVEAEDCPCASQKFPGGILISKPQTKFRNPAKRLVDTFATLVVWRLLKLATEPVFE